MKTKKRQDTKKKYTYTTSYHICVSIRVALDKLLKGQNIFLPSTPNQVVRCLVEAENQGKTYYSGCSRMNAEGKCTGHKKRVII